MALTHLNGDDLNQDRVRSLFNTVLKVIPYFEIIRRFQQKQFSTSNDKESQNCSLQETNETTTADRKSETDNQSTNNFSPSALNSVRHCH